MAVNVAVTTSSVLLPSSISVSCSITSTAAGSSSSSAAAAAAPNKASSGSKHSLYRRSSLGQTSAANLLDFFSSGKLPQRRQMVQGARALFGNKDSNDGKKDDKKFITKEQEPKQYWQTTAEREGKNPMQSVLPYIAIMGLLTPFAILAVAFANNWIKLPQ